MQDFTSTFNEKEITFTETGIRYNNEIFIKYSDMRDISHRTDGKNALIFRFKDRLVNMPYNPDDKPNIMPYLGLAMQISKDAERETNKVAAATQSDTLPSAMAELDKFAYLDQVSKQKEVIEEEKTKKKKKTGLIAVCVALLVVIAAAVVYFIVL